MKYITITVIDLCVAFTHDLVEFNSFEFTTIEDHGKVRVAIRIGYKSDNLAFDYDIKAFETIYGKDNVTVSEGGDLEDPF